MNTKAECPFHPDHDFIYPEGRCSVCGQSAPEVSAEGKVEWIVVKNVCGGDIEISECTLTPGDHKRIPYTRLLDHDIRSNFSRGFIDIVSWPKDKYPISYGESPRIYQLPDGKYARPSIPAVPHPPKSVEGFDEKAIETEWMRIWREDQLHDEDFITPGYAAFESIARLARWGFEMGRKSYENKEAKELHLTWLASKEHWFKYIAELERERDELRMANNVLLSVKDLASTNFSHLQTIEKLRTDLEARAAITRDAKTERDQLRAEVERLKNEIQLIAAPKEIAFTALQSRCEKYEAALKEVKQGATLPLRKMTKFEMVEFVALEGQRVATEALGNGEGENGVR